MSRTQFILFHIVMQALILLITIKYSTSIEAIELLKLTNFYERHVALMIDQTYFDIIGVKVIVNLLLVYSIILLLHNGIIYICYKKLVQSNKLFICIRVEELLRELVMIAMSILILGSSIFLMAPFINFVLSEIAIVDGNILEILIRKPMTTMIVIGTVLSFSGFITDLMKKSIYKIGFKKA